MYPEVIIHNSVSLDHAVTGFEIDIGQHYGALLAFEPGAVLAGSATAKSGIELFMGITLPETEADRHRPWVRPDDPRPVCVIVDSRGVLKNLLHFYRNMEHTKDVVVLVSEATPEDYLDYLRERDYPFIRCGRSRVDLRAAIRELGERFGITRVRPGLERYPDLGGDRGHDQPDRSSGHRRRGGEGTLRPSRGAAGARTPESRDDGAGDGAPGVCREEVEEGS